MVTASLARVGGHTVGYDVGGDSLRFPKFQRVDAIAVNHYLISNAAMPARGLDVQSDAGENALLAIDAGRRIPTV